MLFAAVSIDVQTNQLSLVLDLSARFGSYTVQDLTFYGIHTSINLLYYIMF